MLTDMVTTAAQYGFIEGTRKFGPTPKLRNRLIENYELFQFRKLVAHAYKHSEFYKNLYKAHGIQEKDISHLQFNDVPIVTKKDMVDNTQQVFTVPDLNVKEIEDFIYKKDPSVNIFKDKYHCFTTSGSLGNKLVVVYSAKEWNNILTNMYINSYKPTKLGQKLKIAGIIRTSGTSAAITLFRSMPSKYFEVREFSVLSPLKDIIEELNEYQPDRIVAYPGIFVSLLPYQKNGTLKIFPKFIDVGGEILSPENQKAITELFHARVTNCYGASEVMNMGIKGLGESCFKMLPQFAKVEVLNDKNEHVKPGETGKVVATNFINYTQPFIRYAIGDIASFALNDRGAPCVKEIVSRNYKPVYLQTNNGEESYFHPFIFGDIFWFVDGINKAQIVFGKNSIHAKLVGTESGAGVSSQNFEKFLKTQKLDQNVKFTWERVEDLRPEPNGKIPIIKYDAA